MGRSEFDCLKPLIRFTMISPIQLARSQSFSSSITSSTASAAAHEIGLPA